MKIDKSIETISGKLPLDEVLAQLAEESAELAQAALKLRRAYSAINPTPVTAGQAEDALAEEIADVTVCLEAIYAYIDIVDKIGDYTAYKAIRWASRL